MSFDHDRAFANYDAWLEKPYRDADRRAEAEERAWERFGLDPGDVEPPHRVGDPCPRCGEHKSLALADDEAGGVLYCQACDSDVDPQERPTFDPVAIVEAEAEAEAEAAAEARYERDDY